MLKLTLINHHLSTDSSLAQFWESNSHLQIITHRHLISIEIHLLIIKHFEEHRTKCNLKQNDNICVHCHSYKLNVASKIVVLGEKGNQALNQQPILSQVIQHWNGGPTDVLLSKALNPKMAPGAHLQKLEQRILPKCPTSSSGCDCLILLCDRLSDTGSNKNNVPVSARVQI